MKVWLLNAGKNGRVEAYADKPSIRAAIMQLYPTCQIVEWSDGTGMTANFTPKEQHDGCWAEAWETEVQQLTSGPEIFDNSSDLEGLAMREACDVALEAGATKLPGVE